MAKNEKRKFKNTQEMLGFLRELKRKSTNALKFQDNKYKEEQAAYKKLYGSVR